MSSHENILKLFKRKKECEKDCESKNNFNEKKKKKVNERDKEGNLNNTFENSYKIIIVLLNNLKEVE